jgi:uncharacterized protein
MVAEGAQQRTSLSGLVLVLLVAYAFPILLIRLDIIPFAYRFHVLVAIAILLGAVARFSGMSRQELGLGTEGLIKSLAVNALLALVIGGLMMLAYWQGLVREPTRPNMTWFAPFYVLVSCPAQEFATRGYLFARMRRSGIVHPAGLILISAAVYASLHLIYNDPLTFLAPLGMGIVWATIYWRIPNLWGLMLSHSALGLISIFVGLV